MASDHIETVHLIFKTHLDIGFTDYARNVVAQYFAHFIPRAIENAATLRAMGGDERFVWTTGAWLIYEYLERAAPRERRRLEQAIADGDIAWHGLPFTTHSELADAALFRAGLSMASELDQRFGKRTIAAKMTDVPGHTRAIVPLLAEAGISFLHIGVNPASTPPGVPPVFVWRDTASGAELIVMYAGSYGDATIVPGMRDAIAFAHTNDNDGPQPIGQVLHSFVHLRRRFPQARIIASTMDAFAHALAQVKPQLPVVTSEIGDTWIHGAGSDPANVSQFRELMRLRRQWLADGRVAADDRALAAFSRTLLLIAEHTWGMDEKIYLDDYTNYTVDQLRTARARPNFRRFEASWAEQRGYLRDAIASLGDSPLAQEASDRLAALAPRRPDTSGFTRAEPPAIVETAHFRVGLNPHTGAIATLVDTASGRDWAGADQGLGLFHYEIFAQQDYDRFHRQYNVNKRMTDHWSLYDFTKPGIGPAVAEHRRWQAQLAGISQRQDDDAYRLTLELQLPDECVQNYGCPRQISVELRFPGDAPVIEIEVQWFDKPACRLPEAIWFSFVPRSVPSGVWRLGKLGQAIDPHDVVRDGNRKLHAVDRGATYGDRSGQLSIETLDAPLVAPGAPSLLEFNNRQPRLSQGVHVNLYNNIWGTNFPMWYEEDARFRFTLRCGPAKALQE
jgi:hypothetical protein